MIGGNDCCDSRLGFLPIFPLMKPRFLDSPDGDFLRTLLQFSPSIIPRLLSRWTSVDEFDMFHLRSPSHLQSLAEGDRKIQKPSPQRFPMLKDSQRCIAEISTLNSWTFFLSM
jgi:hypothetical protein